MLQSSLNKFGPKPIIYLDMDECVCDFMNAYYKIEPQIFTDKKFHTLVMEHKIFTTLDWMPNGMKLVTLLENLGSEVNVEMLTSLGTYTPEVAEEGKRQKLEWLKRKGIITWPANFVNSWVEKPRYANKYAILIDDRHDTCRGFREAGGHAIEYVDEDLPEMWNRIQAAIFTVKDQIARDMQVPISSL